MFARAVTIRTTALDTEVVVESRVGRRQRRKMHAARFPTLTLDARAAPRRPGAAAAGGQAPRLPTTAPCPGPTCSPRSARSTCCGTRSRCCANGCRRPSSCRCCGRRARPFRCGPPARPPSCSRSPRRASRSWRRACAATPHRRRRPAAYSTPLLPVRAVAVRGSDEASRRVAMLILGLPVPSGRDGAYYRDGVCRLCQGRAVCALARAAQVGPAPSVYVMGSAAADGYYLYFVCKVAYERAATTPRPCCRPSGGPPSARRSCVKPLWSRCPTPSTAWRRTRRRSPRRPRCWRSAYWRLVRTRRLSQLHS